MTISHIPEVFDLTEWMISIAGGKGYRLATDEVPVESVGVLLVPLSPWAGSALVPWRRLAGCARGCGRARFTLREAGDKSV